MIIDAETNTDSITVGTPSKGGEMKVYFNASDPMKARERIDNALKLRAYAFDIATGGGQA